MNNSNALDEIQSKYKNCNLLIPSSTSVQINPFYKCTIVRVAADTSENSGDIFKVGNIKVGDDRNGNAVYTDVFSLAKPFLMKLATAAGIQFHPEYTTVAKENQNTYVGRAYGAIRLPDSTFKPHMETKRICLDDEEAKYRLEFMDKSIMGIKDWKAAKEAEKMFKGHWEDTDETRAYGGREYPVRKFVIDDCDREKYIERSMLVNMTLLRKTASEKAQTGAILRVIRALLGIKGTYTLEELKRTFAVPTVAFSPDYSDAGVRRAMLLQGMNSMGNMFGTPPAARPFANEASTGIFDIDGSLDSPAFDSDFHVDEENYADDYPQEPLYEEPEGKQQPHAGQEGEAAYQCSGCGIEISESVHRYSSGKFGMPLCMKCQRGAVNGK